METNPTGFAANVITVGATEVQGSDVAIAVGKSIVLTAEAANTHSIYVGVTGVLTTTGFEIAPGAGLTVCVSNLNKLYFIAGAAGQKLRYAVETA